ISEARIEANGEDYGIRRIVSIVRAIGCISLGPALARFQSNRNHPTAHRSIRRFRHTSGKAPGRRKPTSTRPPALLMDQGRAAMTGTGMQLLGNPPGESRIGEPAQDLVSKGGQS